ncbi:hypothetical protein HMP0721_0933 [Pseudoramibacter alactolyticus ATCC 23263]|uniref:Uncharacterized protein n=1 Tax=Pseudoramibacter alactolyticus ATCC 23263 TaxID=887929 RepID=E6MG00_9FIRM|nr:hypothetical protein HMP0721_0933 [Pseudoramibacter alactolyticus ATCC 23263]
MDNFPKSIFSWTVSKLKKSNPFVIKGIVSRQYVNRLIKKEDSIVNKTFVQMLEALGYDIQLTYVKREEN